VDIVTINLKNISLTFSVYYVTLCAHYCDRPIFVINKTNKKVKKSKTRFEWKKYKKRFAYRTAALNMIGY